MAKVKRTDNTAKLMRGLRKASQEAMTEVAQKLQAIARQAVDRPYTAKRKSTVISLETAAQVRGLTAAAQRRRKVSRARYN